MTNARDRLLRSAAIKLVLFALVAILVTVTIAATIRPFGGDDHGSFRAVFSNASRLAPGDEVRANGVVVGRVDGVRLLPDTHAEVRFTLTHDLGPTTGTRAEIRYLNLVGDRTLTLVRGPGSRLSEGATIPLDRTAPALDLNQLFNGFKPLFAALSPADVNGLSMDIIRTLQGEGPTIDSLLQHTASLTRTVADRDAVIGRVVTNLNEVLRTVEDRHGRLDQLVVQLTRFVGGVADDRAAIGTAIDRIGELTEVTAGLVRNARPGLRADIDALLREAGILNKPANRKALEHTLDYLPAKVAEIARTASYGSFFNYYACQLSVKFLDTRSPLLGILAPLLSRFNSLNLRDRGARCHL